MSKHAAASTSVSVSSLQQVGLKKPKRKVSKVRLPTPPPDPTVHDEAGPPKNRPDKDAEFFEYLESLQKSPHQNLTRANSAFAPALATDDAFDHLDKLYKLMKQMLILTEQNSKLHRRVRDLEHLINIQIMQRQLKHVDVVEVPEVDKDTIFAESLLDTILLDTKRDAKPKHPSQFRFRQSILRRQRHRSNSASFDKQPIDMNNLQTLYRRASAMTSPDKKVSKWTKVKAAFKWERASQTVSDVKSQDSGVSGMLPVNCEVARYLRVPSTSEDLGASPADSGAAELSTPGTMSSASSNEEIFFQGRRGIREDTSDDDQSFTLEYIPNSKEESNALQKSSSGKSHRTPWAKMKDIIQTRNSIKKRNRLSAKSDDFRIDESIGSDNEDVFESTNAKNPQFVIHHDCSRTEPFHSNSSDDRFQLPMEVVERYQQIMAEENMYRDADASKWTRVKKAFLSTPSISRPDNSIPSSPISEGHYTMEHNALKSENISKLQEEIQINYRELQNKLSLEFHDKMREWEKIKQSASTNALSNTASGSVSSPDDAKEQAFKKKMEEWEKIKGQTKRNMQLQSEEHLPPEFRKKLQEWQKIKKSKDDASPTANNPKKKLGDWPRWKSISGHRPEAAHLDYQPLSEDFIKKLESWKQMKASASTDDGEASKGYKTPSPKLTRKDGSSSRQSKKGKENPDKEVHRFERERQKFVDREERLTKLRRSVMGGSKKDILVHTPSGFYRFEGISRKFTQKLYEWEKAQGIGPEASTIALLSTCYVPSVHTTNNKRERKRLMKSKSADSFANPELTLNLLNQQPSSLSLNDMEHLETQRLLNMSSVPDIIRSRDNIDPDEPEAVIVEVEDIVEETAGPLVPIMRKKHTPVYQKQETFNMCEGETRAAPKVQRSESTRAQTNYNLIEDIIDLLKLVAENENDISHREATQESQHDSKRTSHYLKNLYHLQEETSGRIIEKFVGLQEANTRVTTSILSEESSYATSRLTDVLDTVQDLSIDLLQLAEKLHGENAHRSSAGRVSNSRQRYPNIFNVLNQQNAKILELRRVLSYLCAASDSTAPTKKKKRNVKGALRKSLSNEKTPKRNSSKKSGVDTEDRNDDLSAQIAQGAIKKRYRFRQKGPNDRTLDESDDDDVKTQRKNRQRRLQKAASAPDEVQTKPEEIDANAVQNVVVPTKPNFVTVPDAPPRDSTDSPIQVFVKTTRRLFTPIVTSSFALESRKVEISASPTVTLVPSFHGDPTTPDNQIGEVPEGGEQVSRLPPLPASPISQRKCSKEISPNIRLMMVRYNQKIQEHEAPRSAGSSGSSSPIAWRSPVNERRVKTQTAKYQQDLLKLSLHPIEVQKSASWGVMNPDHKSLNLMKSPDSSTRGILKSCSASTLTNDVRTKRPLKLTIPDPAPRLDPDARTHKLQKAKEEFLSSPVSPISAPPQLAPEGDIKYPERNRLSQISVGSESSYDSAAYDGLLMKSASAGMINIEVEAYNQIDPEIHGGGYVSLPRYNKKRKEGFMSNIASKFRKVKMRRNKESNKMNTISTLCRQSLVVDINKGSQETLTAEASSRKDSLSVPLDSKGSSSGDTSPSTSRSGSWMRPPRLFKPKQ